MSVAHTSLPYKPSLFQSTLRFLSLRILTGSRVAWFPRDNVRKGSAMCVRWTKPHASEIRVWFHCHQPKRQASNTPSNSINHSVSSHDANFYSLCICAPLGNAVRTVQFPLTIVFIRSYDESTPAIYFERSDWSVRKGHASERGGNPRVESGGKQPTAESTSVSPLLSVTININRPIGMVKYHYYSSLYFARL